MGRQRGQHVQSHADPSAQLVGMAQSQGWRVQQGQPEGPGGLSKKLGFFSKCRGSTEGNLVRGRPHWILSLGRAL